MDYTYRVGERWLTNEGYWVEIIEYITSKNVTIMFEDENILKKVKYDNVKNGQIKNVNHRSIFNLGYEGYGNYKVQLHGVKTENYIKWYGAMRRCYYNSELIRNPTYLKCHVDKYWHNFQNFAKWHEENYIEDWELDKDILFKGNKIYSSETCCYVPKEVNNLFIKSDSARGEYPIGVTARKNKYVASIQMSGEGIHLGTFDTVEEAFLAYKTAKEQYIKEVANIWKPIIKPNVYCAMYTYQVEITD